MAPIEGAFAAVVLTENARGRVPRSRRHPPAGGRPPRRRLGARLRDLRARHHRRDRRARAAPGRAGRDRRATAPATARPCPPRSRVAVHLRVHLLRPARTPRCRARGCTTPAAGWASGWPHEAPVEADVVIPVPDSGTPAAIGFAQASGIPFGEGLVKNRYVGRTFIQPDQGLRERGVKLKFNVLRSVLAGQRVVVVDDSIVRGSTTRKLVADAVRGRRPRGAPAHLVAADHLALLLRHRHGRPGPADRRRPQRRARCATRLGATTLAYLSLDGLQARDRAGRSDRFCRACLTGEYPTEIPDRPAPREAAVRADGRRGRRR